ncbi:MAG: glycosyltransferase [Oscillospiraceae bacterium]|nr:glycosyltransferase [Oscillospiraceae bacterium]
MKILIANNNMKVGGVQKSLCNLLWELERQKKHDVTLLLFSPVGDYMDMLPPGIKCITTKSLFRYMGVSQGETQGWDRLLRGALVAVCRIFGRSAAVGLMRLSQRTLPEEYDCAIAFLHNGKNKSFFGGVQDFVLHCVKAKRKITYLHDDYVKCGANHKVNNRIMARFDTIAACSEGCRGVFADAVPELADKSIAVRNCNDIAAIRAMADEDAVAYVDDRIHVLCAARFSPRKGIDRAIAATAEMLHKGIPMTLHILGSGVQEEQLKAMVDQLGLDEHVHFYGEQANPYRYMKNADLFLLTSYHEAAPMVIDEAYILGVPVLTTRTNSSDEMVTDRACGWVCENDQQALNRMLLQVLQNPAELYSMKEKLRHCGANNELAMKQFTDMIEN